MISQVYNAELTPNEYVMKGNSGIMKCLIPSFVADFVEVTGWVDDSGTEFMNDKKFDSGIPTKWSNVTFEIPEI